MQMPDADGERHGDTFCTDVVDLPAAVGPEVVDVAPGQSFDLRISAVAKSIGPDTVRMMAYNGSIPGPTLRVKQGSEIEVNVANEGDIEATVHWHGLRLANQFDGVPHETQAPIPIGGSYTHRLSFPDAGLFWYHPHIREDFAQEMGLYGNVVVVPSEEDHWPSVDREVVYTLDDVLIEEGRIAPFSRHHSDHTAMGRYGNVLLIGGETEQEIEVRRNEVVRFCLTNTANTRVFNVAVPEMRMKLVGGDAGRYEREELVQHVTVAPSERAIIDVLFDRPGNFALIHATPGRNYPLAKLAVVDEPVESSASPQFARLRTNAEMVAERERIASFLDAPPDKTLALIAEMDMIEPSGGAVVYQCPMHPEVASDQPGTCPKCGMKLMPQAVPAPVYQCPMHPEVASDQPGTCPKCGMKLMPQAVPAVSAEGPHHEHQGEQPIQAPGHHAHEAHAGDDDGSGIEWEDLMVDINRLTTPDNMRWKLVDRATGKENAEIDWKFRAGDQVKIRLINEMHSDHPMHHPIHIHGQRFLVLSRDGVQEPNLVWKDTVLVTTGQVVDILMDGSNPGLWMLHCHIAEHNEGGMMFSFRVDRA